MDTMIEGVLFVLLYLVPLFFILSIGGYVSDKIEDYLCNRAESINSFRTKIQSDRHLLNRGVFQVRDYTLERTNIRSAARRTHHLQKKRVEKSKKLCSVLHVT